MQVYPNRLEESLHAGLKPVYLIFGDEPQQKLEAIQRVRDAARQQGFDERQSLVADKEFQWHSLTEATQTLSLFSARQLIELELPSAKPGTEGAKTLTEFASNTNPDTLLIVHGTRAGKDVQSTKWFKSLDKQGVFVPCYPLEGNQLQQWIAQRCRTAGLNVDQAVCKLLADFCEGNMLAASQEIEKLALLFADKPADVEAVQHALVDQSRFNVFQLIDVLLSGDAQKAVKMLCRLESEGLEPTIISWALLREWQTLYEIKLEMQKGNNVNWMRHRIWKNRQPIVQAALRRLSMTHLQSMLKKLQVLDSQLKSQPPARPFIELCHCCLLFIPVQLDDIALA
ncbi:DNA polymerase III subunit delta [Aestuariibacter salexigens]|uniref:DNA polymerase III subunit delta n=1 Tax=Aestuariibacter salexigens TaxID=226010 RepID=UPI000401818A|nr:DNA polymerase III subunit delta [Aestuariibacter salexigens]